MVRIRYQQSIFIKENRAGFFKRNSVFLLIDIVFDFIPIK